MCVEGVWGSVCGSGWTKQAAFVICINKLDLSTQVHVRALYNHDYYDNFYFDCYHRANYIY